MNKKALFYGTGISKSEDFINRGRGFRVIIDVTQK
jgi:hypothetical protein